ncbi:DeoR/GlpR family DNA-binding transcription regulator [Acuticoccus sp. MNP-M23]|uniref:DeoR/GlpR family DNA-binding transcription regulator n=1 Tax=Acuticoccus sp. MNP-M23 TaxID=3072793 RepID=UPI0028163DBF|nr:DeoR/GlpR family DNA-binding transcription regulator [Acuticoccus sp. MNP-M23]WMS43746.1 DeoR/GlpR family DNA-binding transcription regulator [Acuticoccus sp. MNP-M23]
MLTHDRKAHLLSLLAATGSVVAKDVSRDLGLSEDTIRRDLRELARDGLLKRVHGGAVPLAAANAPFPSRVAIASPEKVAIGKRAARMVEPGQVVFVDGGTTALQLVRHLAPRLAATVITHSPNVAMALLEHEGLTIEIVGGRLFRHSVVTTGAATLAWLDRYRPDICFIGATGVHTAEGITTGDSEEAEVKRAVIAKSGSAIVLASPEKLGAVSSFAVARLADIDGLVVSKETHAKAQKEFDPTGCEIYSGD